MLNTRGSHTDWDSLAPDEKRKATEVEAAKLRCKELQLKREIAVAAAKDAEARRKKSPVLVAFNGEDRVPFSALVTTTPNVCH